ncbi:carbonic anhydrase [Aquimarina rhabdastrellae]
MKKYLIIVTVLSLLSISCKQQGQEGKDKYENEKQSHKDSSHLTWEYEGEMGPEHWADTKINADCGERFQSPINIIKTTAVKATDKNLLAIHYGENTKIHEVINNGHTIQYNFEKGDYILVEGKRFDLKQIHFHEASEHTINGIRYPMEIHMVHANNQKEYAVLGVLVEEGLSSKPFEFLEKYLPIKIGEKKAINKAFNVNLNLPQNKSYYHYTGSFTTPPCTEGVKWFVFQEPITVSLEQVRILQKIMPMHNYRIEQPLNGREIQLFE